MILQAFSQRVVNGGGQVTREMASGNGRLDLCVHYGAERYPVEVKVWRSAKTYQEGIAQMLRCLDKLGCDEGWLIVFDRRPDQLWDEKIFWETQQTAGKMVHVVGC